jgi:hypothetical protein
MPYYLTPMWGANTPPPCGPTGGFWTGYSSGPQSGTGFLSWPASPTEAYNTGNAGYDVWAQGGPGTGMYGTVQGFGGTYAGFSPVVSPGNSFVGLNYVSFNWNMTWNYTADLTGAGMVSDNLTIYAGVGYFGPGCSGPIASSTDSVLGYSSTTPVTASGGTGGVNATYNVTVTISGGLAAGSVVFESAIYSSIYASETSSGLANAEVNVGSSGAGAWLVSIQTW